MYSLDDFDLVSYFAGQALLALGRSGVTDAELASRCWDIGEAMAAEGRRRAHLETERESTGQRRALPERAD